MQDVIVRTRSYTIINSDELKEALKNMRNDIGARILDVALYQSGLMVVKVKEIHMMYNKYNPTRAGKYINLPKWISSKKACINIKHKDDTCFLYVCYSVWLSKTVVNNSSRKLSSLQKDRR